MTPSRARTSPLLSLLSLLPLLPLLAVLATPACTSAGPAPSDAAPPTDAAPLDDAVAPTDAPAPDATDAGLVGARPYRSRAPRAYTAERAWPLVLLLHGYGASGAAQELYFGLSREVDARGFLLAYPDGTVDAEGRRFWNATRACCDFAQTGVDDVAYLTAVLDDMAARYRVDPARVFVVGHSNGGFMAQRLACERAERIAAVVSLAGAIDNDPARCAPARSVAVLQIHGDNDAVIRYAGGMTTPVGTYPSARDTVRRWAALNGCSETLATTARALDLDLDVTGSETTVAAHTGCRPGGAAELWTIVGGGHIPSVGDGFRDETLTWLFAHAR